MAQKHQVTEEGLKKMKAELEKLRSQDRPQTVKRMALARELGDLSENADYQDAREQLAFIEGRIEELEAILGNAEVVMLQTGSNVAQIGTTITIETNGKSVTYEIVGANEGDPLTGKLSAESPVGRALVGHAQGDAVDVKTPNGVVKYKILKIA